MKISFDTTQDQHLLRKMINYAIMHTDQWVLNPLMWKGQRDYTLLMLELRKNCYRFLEEEDPNEHVLNEMVENIK